MKQKSIELVAGPDHADLIHVGKGGRQSWGRQFAADLTQHIGDLVSE